ncbi:MAG: TetR/AcrR family transcriptional regulator [Deltaproteobacteria bacterium]|nr:TetR/AcrR family transcriptional regulator [Deltaproteobacteria bacterium]MBW2447292.1 TetR/AcrR family transcriptional regulator [Deltaproteobacteria bacterium]
MSPTTPRARTARSAPEAPARRGRPSRRADIFSAALRLFRERGFHATSINDIGDAAGVAGTAVYSHFATKQDVLAEAIREGAVRIGAGLKEALADESEGADAALESLVRAYVRVVLENADMNACYVLEARNLETDVRHPLVRSERLLRDGFRRRLLDVRPELSNDQARTMVQMAIFAVVALCVHRNRIERDALVEQATSFVLGALHSPVPNTNP